MVLNFGPSTLPNDFQLDGVGDLAKVLGGDKDSWTEKLLLLIAKSDPIHREALCNGVENFVRAYELWMSMSPSPTAREFLDEKEKWDF